MYGSYQCPHCTTQKYLFGEKAFKYINYVECHPGGKNANPALCLEKGITRYPTWEINGRFYVGAMSLQRLAEISGYTGYKRRK
jgi:glutaredoxin